MSEETEDYKRGYAQACKDMKAVQEEAYRRLFAGKQSDGIGLGQFLEDKLVLPKAKEERWIKL